MPVGAVLVSDGEVIARAHNCVELSGDPTAHAELLVIQQACCPVCAVVYCVWSSACSHVR